MIVFAVVIEGYKEPAIVSEIVASQEEAKQDLLRAGFVRKQGLWINPDKLRIAWIDKKEFYPSSSLETTVHKTRRSDERKD